MSQQDNDASPPATRADLAELKAEFQQTMAANNAELKAEFIEVVRSIETSLLTAYHS